MPLASSSPISVPCSCRTRVPATNETTSRECVEASGPSGSAHTPRMPGSDADACSVMPMPDRTTRREPHGPRPAQAMICRTTHGGSGSSIEHSGTRHHGQSSTKSVLQNWAVPHHA